MSNLEIKEGSKFRKDIDKLKKQGKNMILLLEVLEVLEQNLTLDSKYKDHPLQGKLKKFRDCHITPDWILIYQIDLEKNVLYLFRTGSHSDLF